MDPTTEYLSDYACSLTYEDLSPEAVHQVKRTLVDTLGCGVGAFDSEPASIARRMASRVQGNPPARILGTCAGDVYGSGGLREYGSCPLPRL